MIPNPYSYKTLPANILIVRLCLMSQLSLGEQLNLIGVVDILNFARHSIDSGKLKLFTYLPSKPPKPSADE